MPYRNQELEAARVEMVRSFGLIGQPRARLHDEIANLAGEAAGTPWSVVTLVDADRNWLSGALTYADLEACRWTSFSTHTVAKPDDVLWVADALADPRFSDDPYVTGEPHLRFYAGAPVLVNGQAVAAVCIFDIEPRVFDPSISKVLTRLATVVGEDLAARHQAQSLLTAVVAGADALIDCDDRGTITGWSDGAEHLFGFSADEAVGSNIQMIIPEEQRANHNRGLEKWRLNGGGRLGRRIELPACCKDGTTVDIELWMSSAHVQGIPHLHANIRDISERKAQSRALVVAKGEAEAANRAKSEFLANMSHELRTPLNGVIGVADLLAGTEQTAHQRELTSVIRASSDLLGRLIGDILDLARIEAGELAIEETPMELSDVIDSVLSLSSLTAREKGLALSSQLAPDVARQVRGDALRLKQVLTNLISNAVKFTDRGSVVLRVSREGISYRFEISDTGVGFDDAQREIIFGRFQQADGTITRRFGGSGLGLAISRELVVAMGGVLDGQGVLGKGATFWFTLPLEEEKGLGPESRQSAEVPHSVAGRVLVVDDNATNRRVAELILHTVGIEVDCVEDGHQAVEAFLTCRYDVILMDMMMPIMDGIAATQAIRELERKSGVQRTPVIMLTASTMPKHVEASLDAGADFHLAKPVTAPALYEALARVQQSEERPVRSLSVAITAEAATGASL